MISLSYVNSQVTKISYISEVKIVKIVVTQGFVLDPLLFIIYTNDIIYSLNDADLVCYADNTSVISDINQLARLGN